MKRFVVLSVLAGFLSACGTTVTTLKLNPVSVEFIEHRTFWSTTSVAIVHEGGRVVGIGSGTGKPIAGFVADLTSTAVTGAVLGYIGTQLPKINTGTSQVQIQDVGGMAP